MMTRRGRGSVSRREAMTRNILSVFTWLGCLIIGFPLYWMVSSAFKPPREILASPQTWFPSEMTLDNFKRVLDAGASTWFLNSLFVSGSTVGIVIILGALGAYSMTRFRYAGREAGGMVVLFAYLFPSTLLIVPLFIIINDLGMGDSHRGLILANLTLALPFSLWLLRGYFIGLPIQVEEAALIDGAGRMRSFVEVVIPQVAPGILSTAVFVGITTWNQYLFALVFITSAQRYTLPLGMARYANALDAEWGSLMAASVIATLPVLALYVVIHRRFHKAFGLEE